MSPQVALGGIGPAAPSNVTEEPLWVGARANRLELKQAIFLPALPDAIKAVLQELQTFANVFCFALNGRCEAEEIKLA